MKLSNKSISKWQQTTVNQQFTTKTIFAIKTRHFFLLHINHCSIIIFTCMVIKTVKYTESKMKRKKNSRILILCKFNDLYIRTMAHAERSNYLLTFFPILLLRSVYFFLRVCVFVNFFRSRVTCSSNSETLKWHLLQIIITILSKKKNWQLCRVFFFKCVQIKAAVHQKSHT